MGEPNARLRRHRAGLVAIGWIPALTLAGSIALAPGAAAVPPAPRSQAAASQPSAASPVADPARLAAAVERLRRTNGTAVQAAADSAAEMSRLAVAETSAEQGLADAQRVLRGQRATQSAQVRELYVSGGNLSMIGELLTGGRPDDLVDRVLVATAVAAHSTVTSSAAEAATREAADYAVSIAKLADQQIALATTAGQRAAALTISLKQLAAELADAQEAARLAAERRAARAAASVRAARTADSLLAASAAANRFRDLTTNFAAAESATSALLTTARQAGSAGSRHVPVGSVPSAYRTAIQRAGDSCPPSLTPTLLAAQLATESGWNPLAVSSSGAQGLGQFLPSTWLAHGVDGNGDRRADPFDPFDAIASAAAYDCAVARLVAGVAGDPVALMLAAYNAGPNAVIDAGGVPASTTIATYINRIRGTEASYGAGGILR